MSHFVHNSVGISAIAACVPKTKYFNLFDNRNFSQEDAESIVDKTGVVERRVASSDVCSSDLAFAAANELLKGSGIDASSIDVLIFVSQTPDYRMPATSILLQDRLKLSKKCAAFDVNLGCSGFVYGLNLALNLATQESIHRVMLINAETRTKVYSFKDRKTGFLFGDAASACIIEKGSQYGKSWFKLDSDGSKADYIMIKSGGYRYPTTKESLLEKEYENGSIRTDEQAYMNGQGIFEFVITEVPRHINGIIKYSMIDKHDIDFFILHQANKFMNNHLVKKLRLDPIKVPQNLERFGNTSSVSIPLTIVTELLNANKKSYFVLLSGFGVGLSLGSSILRFDDLYIHPLVEI